MTTIYDYGINPLDYNGRPVDVARLTTDSSGNTVLAGAGGTIRPVAKTGANFVLIGDSITAQANNKVTVSALARASNVVTATATGHGLVTGQRVKVCNAMPDDFNGIYTITRDTDANGGDNAFTFTSIGSDGSATLSGHPSSGTFEVRIMDWYLSRGWWTWLESAFSGGINLVENLAFGGWTSHYIVNNKLDYFDTVIGDTPVTDICVAVGINDAIAGTSVADIVSDLQAICTWAKGKGARVWLETIKPVASGYANSTNINELVAKVNRELRSYAASADGIYLVDTYSAVVNPATGHITADLVGTDNIHTNEKCARVYLGPTWYAAMNGIVKPANYLAMGVFDNYGADTASKVLWDVGPWAATTGGSASGSVTGDIAATLVLEEGGSGSAVGAIAARSDGFGYDQQGTFTAVANNDVMVVRFAPTVARCVGQTVRALIPFTLTGNTAGNVKGLYAYIKQTVDSNAGNAYGGANADSVDLWGTSDDTITGVLCTPWMDIDAAATAIQVGVNLYCAGAGTPVLKVGRITVLKQ